MTWNYVVATSGGERFIDSDVSTAATYFKDSYYAVEFADLPEKDPAGGVDIVLDDGNDGKAWVYREDFENNFRAIVERALPQVGRPTADAPSGVAQPGPVSVGGGPATIVLTGTRGQDQAAKITLQGGPAPSAETTNRDTVLGVGAVGVLVATAAGFGLLWLLVNEAKS